MLESISEAIFKIKNKYNIESKETYINMIRSEKVKSIRSKRIED